MLDREVGRKGPAQRVTDEDGRFCAGLLDQLAEPGNHRGSVERARPHL
jgi:hypothetical protein